MQIFTIGFTQKSAQQFFESLIAAKIEVLMDVRLNNVSQLAGFSKRNDLEYFLRKICLIEYQHEKLMAPTQPMLDDYKKGQRSWELYSAEFINLLEQRKIENSFSKDQFEKRTVLLCSELLPQHCHRSLVVDYLASKWGSITAVHL